MNQYLDKFQDYQHRAEIYYVYQTLHRYTEEPFTSHLPEALFNMARFLLHNLSQEIPYGNCFGFLKIHRFNPILSILDILRNLETIPLYPYMRMPQIPIFQVCQKYRYCMLWRNRVKTWVRTRWHATLLTSCSSW